MHLPALSLSLTLATATLPSAPAQAGEVETARAGYDQARRVLELERLYLRDELLLSRKRSERQEVLKAAQSAVLSTLDTVLVPAWKGTAWTFSGTSETPGDGSIACGFFVGTLLAHAGFHLDRIAIGRLASEHIALSLTSNANLRRYSNAHAEAVAAEVLAWGPGLYAVGLDYHAALLRVTDSGELWFIHSTVWGEGGVVVEPLIGDNPFYYSRYRVVARLLDDRMLTRWLEGDSFPAFVPS